MAKELSLLMFFNTDRLSGAERFDRGARARVVEEGVQELSKQFPHARIASPNPTACSVNLSGSHEVIEELVAYLEQRGKEFGTYVIDGLMIRPAREKPATRSVGV